MLCCFHHMSHRTVDNDNFWNSIDIQADSKKFDHLTRFLPVDARTVLDIGAGNGALHVALKKHRSVSYTGIDASPEAIRRIESGGGTGMQADIDGVRLPFADNSFDVVFACDILEHVRNPWILLGEMARVSKKYVVIHGPNFVSLKCRLQVLSGRPPYQMAADKYGAVFNNSGHHVDHIYFITYNNILHWASKMQLRVEKAEGYWYRRYAPFRWFLQPLFGNWCEVYRMLLIKNPEKWKLPEDRNVQVYESFKRSDS